MALGLLSVALAACTEPGDGERIRATVLEAPTQGESAPGRDHWVVVVELRDGKTIIGSDRANVGFGGDELRCGSGAAVEPTEVAVGDELRFRRRGDDADTSDPPGVGGEEVRLQGC